MKLTILLLTCIIFVSCSSKHRSPTIANIQENPENFADGHYFYLQGVTISETQSFLNYAISSVEDPTGQILFVSSVPYKKGRKLKVKVKYIQLISNKDQTVELVVDKRASETVERYAPIILQFGLQNISNFFDTD